VSAEPAQYASAVSVDREERLEAEGRLDRRRDRGWLMRRMLLGADVVAVLVSVALAGVISDPYGSIGTSAIVLAALGGALAFVVGAKLFGLYDFDAAGPAHSTVDEVVRIFVLATVELFLIAQIATVVGNPFRQVAILWLLAIGSIAAFRGAARAVGRRHQAYVQRAVIVGAGEIGQIVARKILQHPEYGMQIVGFVDADPRDRREFLRRIPVLGPLDALPLPQIVEEMGVDRVLVAFSGDKHDRMINVVRSLHDAHVHIDIVPRFFDVVGSRAVIRSLEGLPLVGLPVPRLSRSSALLKRAFDLVVAGLGLVILAPLFALVAVAIKLDSRGPVFFRQVRIGSGNEPFTILKFRTMVANAEDLKQDVAHLNKHLLDGGDARMFKIPADPRCTRFGQFLRRYSIDELPQLLNVLSGKMTVVGPRPLIPEEHAYVQGWAERRLKLKPGATGLWQVLGRDDIPFAEMIALDYLYVVNWSLLGDIKLILQTVPALFRRRAVH
jgi:exopolysaccharide biosynthesis polyprenyl glycosylphosphotransferase